MPVDGKSGAEKQQAALTFVLGACWVAIALVTVRQAQRTIAMPNGRFIWELLTTALVSAGLYWIGRRTVRNLRPSSSIGLVDRPTRWNETGIGVALGWAVSIALIVPALLTLHMRSNLSVDMFHMQEAVFSILLLFANALTTQLIFTGLLFRSLVRATTGSIAVLLMSCLAGAVVFMAHTGDVWQAIFSGAAQVLFSIAALRTRAIWVPWGIQFGWGCSLLVLFGVPSFYWPSAGGPVQSFITGPRALTGGYLGPEASAWAFFVVMLAVAALWRATRDYAWHYTFDPIEGAGYPMDVAPPREHSRMEAERDTQSNLVQIAPVLPSSRQIEAE